MSITIQFDDDLSREVQDCGKASTASTPSRASHFVAADEYTPAQRRIKQLLDSNYKLE